MSKVTDSSRVLLVENEGGLFLKLESGNASALFRPDFSSAQMRRRMEDEERRRGLLLKAVEGRKSSAGLKAFDFYSGFGGDAFLLACMGHAVISCEKNEWIARVTQRAWEEQKAESWVADLGVDLKFVEGDSRLYLLAAGEMFDVVYMDPMFEKLKSTAKSPLPMQIAQVLLKGAEQSFEEDFLMALKVSSKVVVKMPLKGKALVSRLPSHQLFGKTVRFDIFVQS